jgi:hypothetical protein
MGWNYPFMTATLQLNLSDTLSADELRELTFIATSQNKTLEKVLYEAAKDWADKKGQQEEVAA